MWLSGIAVLLNFLGTLRLVKMTCRERRHAQPGGCHDGYRLEIMGLWVKILLKQSNCFSSKQKNQHWIENNSVGMKKNVEGTSQHCFSIQLLEKIQLNCVIQKLVGKNHCFNQISCSSFFFHPKLFELEHPNTWRLKAGHGYQGRPMDSLGH